MSKEKRAADLDAELAALEAELAALEAGTRKKAPKAPKAQAPRATAPTPDTEPAPAPASKRRGFFLGRKTTEPAAPDERAAPVAPPAPDAAPPVPLTSAAALPETARNAAPDPATTFDLSLWRNENGAWIRRVATPPRTVRRILDAEGNLVREEPAHERDVQDVGAVKAERGIGRLFRRRSE